MLMAARLRRDHDRVHEVGALMDDLHEKVAPARLARDPDFDFGSGDGAAEAEAARYDVEHYQPV